MIQQKFHSLNCNATLPGPLDYFDFSKSLECETILESVKSSAASTLFPSLEETSKEQETSQQW